MTANTVDGRNAPGYAFDEVRLICEERKRELAAAARFRDGLKVGCVVSNMHD